MNLTKKIAFAIAIIVMFPFVILGAMAIALDSILEDLIE